ncbi:MAG: N-formylglutamate amidohydrolase [Candidatus Cloacimonetes bacterium]|nr:N-formylglutamate amidohydrolase [Candidatus Cloacimonadota bacterium]
MKESFFEVSSSTPILAVALHGGHQLRDEIKKIIGLSNNVLLHEEDPFTDYIASAFDSRIIQNTSRFEYDINRSPQSAVYKIPSDCWNLPIYPNQIKESISEQSQQKYSVFYKQIDEMLNNLLNKFSKIFIWDIHSFNNRGRPDINSINDNNSVPDICLGTSNSHSDFYPLFKEIAENLRTIDFFGKNLSVDFNNPFPGGYFARYLHHHFAERVAVFSIEFNKRVFMQNTHFQFDETNGMIDIAAISRLREMLLSQNQIILNHLK